jgi:hypothetical protein
MCLLNLFKNYIVQYMFWPRKTELPEGHLLISNVQQDVAI